MIEFKVPLAFFNMLTQRSCYLHSWACHPVYLPVVGRQGFITLHSKRVLRAA